MALQSHDYRRTNHRVQEGDRWLGRGRVFEAGHEPSLFPRVVEYTDETIEVYHLNMDIQIQAVSKEEEEVLHNLMEFYIYEFTKYMSTIKINEDGCFDRFNLDAY